YQEQTNRQDDLRRQSGDILSTLCKEMAIGVCNNPTLELLLREISEKLPSKGKMQYGYMQPAVKNLIDAAVDELAKDERVSACYDAWYAMRNEVYHTYTDNSPPKLPLSQQKEFKPIKNMVLQQVMAIRDILPDMSVPDSLPEKSELEIVPQDMPPDTEAPIYAPNLHVSWTAEYKQARAYLFGSKNTTSDFEQAHELLLREAHNGNAFAMHDLGRMYADGLGVDADSDAAYQWYKQALVGFHHIESAMNDDERSATYLRYRIGKMYMAGLGTEQDYSKAVTWLTQAADDNHKYAQYSLGSLYYRGQGVEQDYEMAFGLYSKSSEQENAYASYELGKMYRDGIGTEMDVTASQSHFQTAFNSFVAMELEGSDDKLQYRIGQMLRDGVGAQANNEEATFYFERSAALGNPYAQYALAKQYLKSGEPEKVVAALKLLQKSVAIENSMALYALGKIYRDGVAGVLEANISKAIGYFTQAAEQNNDFAAYVLGRLYLDGESVSQDIPAALHWLQQSADQNKQFAQYALGKLYRDGVDGALESDIHRAMEYLVASAAQNNNFAAYALGKLYLDGENISQDVPAALHWLGKAADQGNPFALYTLGKVYLTGELIPRDVPVAVELLTRSAEQGNQFAQYTLGKLYLMGKEIEQDRELARHWLELSAAQGNEYAQFFLDHFEEIGSHDPDLFMASTNLLRQLGKIFEDQHRQMQGQIVRIDRKRLRVLREKKISQGHAWDDHEQEYGGKM
ncbi:sel1 repeat family protein, partial [Ruminococcaceae bacterium OttesenSCG-928-L11]|nr:sel1 repeat family protein [Ruminococcaceae bacterium OttesenSCG-928-L11]